MRLFGFDKIHAKILGKMAAEPNAEVYEYTKKLINIVLVCIYITSFVADNDES